MWLINSSIGRKFVMAITGCCLVLFVTFHVLMNSVAIFWPTAYNSVCEFLGANWYALIASAGLALLFIIHIVYALWLTFQNRAARGTDRYAVNTRPPQVEWSSKNMLVLGIVVVAFLVVHLCQFWYKMQYQELMHHDLSVLPQLDGVPVQPALGTLFLQMAFSAAWVGIVYIIGFIALWFHMNHGFWSMFQTVGWDNTTWLPRLKKVSLWWTSVVVVLFIVQVGVFTWRANDNYYTENPELQEQYAESWFKQVEAAQDEFDVALSEAQKPFRNIDFQTMDMASQMKAQQDLKEAQDNLIKTAGRTFVNKMTVIDSAFQKQCPDVMPTQEMQQALQMKAQFEALLKAMDTPLDQINNQR